MSSEKMIHKSFDISEKPWWDKEYNRGTGDIIKQILHLKDALKTEVLNDFDYCQGYTVFHHQRYTTECIAGECNRKINVTDVENILNSNIFQMLYYWIFNRIWYNLIIKIQNVFRVASKLFPSSFVFTPCSLDDFNVDFVKSIHREVGQGIISNAGMFRTNDAAPAGEPMFEYLKPDLIEEKLEQLLRECRVMFSESSELTLTDAVKYGACFLERFLFIHPFSNGNGRTARLLLSYLLRNFTTVPLSLYTSNKRREDYLNCLREGRYDNKPPSLLARFILEAMEKEYGLYCYLMDCDVNWTSCYGVRTQNCNNNALEVR